MEMVRMAIRGNLFEPSDVELRLEGPSYTVETLKILTGEYGAENRLSLILGRIRWSSLQHGSGTGRYWGWLT